MSKTSIGAPRHGCRLLAALAIGWALPGIASADDLLAQYGGCTGSPERIFDAGPGDYQTVLANLQAGDLLRLAAGTYASGLNLRNVEGEPGRCIVIEGPESGATARFTGRPCCNTVALGDSSYLVVRHLELDGGDLTGVDAIKAEGDASFAHHITLEDLWIHGHGNGQQTVGISTKCPAWNWVIRRNVIVGGVGDPPAGTGMYLGDSGGEAEFVHGLIEHNLVVDTVGYNAQIKHQNGRTVGLGIPVPGTTVIRHNVFSKAENASGGFDARPNLLVGHFPLSGPGSADRYEIYGNFFYQNATGFEGLFQGTGNIGFYSNLLFNSLGPGAFFQDHEGGQPRDVRAFRNTIVAAATGMAISGAEAGFDQRMVGNAVFSPTPLSGGVQLDNLSDALAAAATYLAQPTGSLPGLDLYPLAGALGGLSTDTTNLTGYRDWDRDFDDQTIPVGQRGAYGDDGAGPTWGLALERQPEPAIFADGFESGDLAAWSAP